MDNYSNFDMHKYDTMLIIGNGFDLSLGFQTSYRDFMKSSYINNLFENDLVKFLRSKLMNQSWIDIEQELKEYSTIIETRCLDNVYIRKRTNDTFRNEYNALCEALKRYLEKISDYNLINSEVLDRMHKSAAYHVLKDVLSVNKLCIVSFNYTPFIEYLCSEITNTLDSYEILNIHGSIKSQSDIVFGIEDSPDIPQEHSFLYKSHSLYQKNDKFERILSMVNKIIFFGYSLGPTDHSYFKHFFVRCNNKKMKFYYHNDDSYDNLIFQLQRLSGYQLSNFKSRNEIEFINTQNVNKAT